jgi:hypothetical protein
MTCKRSPVSIHELPNVSEPQAPFTPEDAFQAAQAIRARGLLNVSADPLAGCDCGLTCTCDMVAEFEGCASDEQPGCDCCYCEMLSLADVAFIAV